ncbi:MAG TPA: SDR family NAD(P)-dependent oxidoreductase [Candidatus Elarobacter sp.]
MRTLDGTVALVTGASSGIGEATALALAAQGARVAIVARRRDRLDALAERIRASDGDALVLEADVTDESRARAVVAETVAHYGRLDTLVNNAGVMLLGPISDADVGEWKRMLDLNVSALMYCAHAALPHLLRAAAGGPRNVADLVNVSSVAGRNARAGAGVYNATKFAVGAFSEALRPEVTKKQVRVSLVEPGETATELREQNRSEIQAKLPPRSEHPLQAADVADAILYIVTRAAHVAINEVLIRPTQQER